jgi:prolyl 4-hydroxylase
MDFIYRKNNFLSADICNDFITRFESSSLPRRGRIATKNNISIEMDYIKQSTDITFWPNFLENEENKKEWGDLISKFQHKLQFEIDNYVEKYETLENMDRFVLEGYNIQKYEPTEGFHQWHCERGNPSTMQRMLVFMVYLNDLESGGTEFKYQEHTEKAEEGKLLIWPTDWTHTHRGQISKTETKYILTGWYSFKL